MSNYFTFKYEPKPTGLARIGSPLSSSQIKYKGKVCGTIAAPDCYSKTPEYRVRFAVKNEDGKGWKWITLKHKDSDEKAIREWIKKHTHKILEKYNLHFFED